MTDNVNHPKHYTGFSNGAEVVDITEHLSFNLGNVVKYVARAGRKTADPTEDLRKAQFYLDREILRLQTLQDEHQCMIDNIRDQLQTMREQWATNPSLPEGLEPVEGKTWRDNEDFLWKFMGDKWFYYEPEDEEWVDVTGPPSALYAPFREVNLWHEG